MTEYTPIIQQYLDIKSQHMDKILLFRVGDFYELFFDDAIEVSKLLFLTLTRKSKSNGNFVPMAGFPVRYANNYIYKLMRFNKKVAICEQFGCDRKNGLIERRVSRILTPGTFLDDDFLPDSNNYIVCITFLDDIYGLAVLDVSTGYFFITRVDDKSYLISELDKLNPVEVLISDKSTFSKIFHKKFFINEIKHEKFNYDLSYNTVLNFFGIQNIKDINYKFFYQSIISAGVLLDFVLSTQNNKLENVIALEFNFVDKFLYLDSNSIKNLEIFDSFSKNEKDSLFNVIDKTSTPFGKRLLRRWLAYPILSHEILVDRHVSVSNLITNQICFIIKSFLTKIFDIERILGKIVFSSVKPIDLKRLQISLAVLPDIKIELKKLKLTGILESICHNIGIFDDIVNLIDRSIVNNPPSNISDGKVIKDDFDNKIDGYRYIINNINSSIYNYQESEKNRLDINNLYITPVLKSGYIINVPLNDVYKIGSDYKKISCNSKFFKYSSDDLINIEKRALDAEVKLLDREKRIYKVILYKIKKKVFKIQSTAKYIALLDVLNSFALQSVLFNWCEPILVNESVLDIKAGRHPVVEYKKNNIFVPNDIFLNIDLKGLIITGANMGGKSTYMRQSAIIILLAYIGSHVPASFAKVGNFDKIFTRIGAGDDLANSYSTFMLEMSEMSGILKNATANSFILIDEIGRGTGYFDGKALAFSIIKELLDYNKSFFMFSTHFYDLHGMCNFFSSLGKIYFVAINNENNIIFHYSFEKGFSDQSFGIEVASSAGLPKSVIDLAYIKRDEFKKKFFFDCSGLSCRVCLENEELIKFINDIDPNSLSPKQALEYFYFLKNLLDKR